MTVASVVEQELRRQGVDIELHGDVARLRVDGRTWSRRLVEHRAGPDDLGLEAGEYMIIGETVPASVVNRAIARDAWYADAAGNAYLRAPGVHINILGRRPRPVRPPAATPAVSLFATRRAQAIFCLLQWSEMISAPISSLADASGASRAVVHETRKLLEAEGYLVPGSGRLQRREVLRGRWVESFRAGLWRAGQLATFVGEPNLDAWLDAGQRLEVSGESAVAGVRPTTLTLYVDEIDPLLVARSRWRRPEPTEQGNIVLRRQFWNSPIPNNPLGERVHLAPELIIYADLMATREPRQLEIAARFLATVDADA